MSHGRWRERSPQMGIHLQRFDPPRAIGRARGALRRQSESRLKRSATWVRNTRKLARQLHPEQKRRFSAALSSPFFEPRLRGHSRKPARADFSGNVVRGAAGWPYSAIARELWSNGLNKHSIVARSLHE